jgi:pimeloyl-ACP methyl ester carboxylesterase
MRVCSLRNTALRLPSLAAVKTRPVVLVHGLAGSARWWRDTEDALSQTHAVHALDLPGFGSERRAAFALADAPAHVAERLEQIGPAHLIGHSLGGLVCARVAARRPELVDRLVLVAPAGSLTRTTIRAHAVPLAHALGTAAPSFLRLLAAEVVRAGPRTILNAARELLRDDVLLDLRAIKAETLLVWGERDALVPPSVGEIFRAELPNARLELLAGARHVPMVERPRAFTALLEEFLA